MDQANPNSQNSRLLYNIIGVTLMLIVMTLIIASPWLTPMFKKEKVMYCHVETDQSDANYSRYQCTNLKIVSKDMDQINLTQFGLIKGTNIRCSEDINDMPDCQSNNFYFSKMQLTDLCMECKTDGYVCAEYQFNWQSNDTKIMNEMDSYKMLTKVAAKGILRNMLINCEG